ncbi:MAG: Rpn family recombination-promoting nuclease/putative transposase, partial [Micrococcales bacterium]|nr:Rpn family recombination-promoting nuclease/putative transposase [Micrococcales bacterium]
MDTPTPASPALVVVGAFVPPRYDLMFKTIFSDEHNSDLLAGFLRPVLKLPEADWTTLALPDTHTLATWPDDKVAVLDVKVVTATGRHVDVEVQLFPSRDLVERVLFYNASMMTSQMVRGAAYDTIHQTISVLITDFVVFDDQVRHHRFVYHDREHDVTLTELSVVHVIELPKLCDDDDGTVEWQWLRFLAANTPEEMAMAAADNPDIARAATLVRHFNADEQFRYEQAAHERFLHDQASRQRNAHLDGFDEGHAEGLAKGHAEGLTEGH